MESIVKKIDKSQIEKYSTVYGNLDGHREKEFVRCTGDVFGDLFYELRNNINSSYVTYCNDVIKEGYNPQYLSVLKKSANMRETEIREILCGKILNYFELPVVYDTFVKIDDEDYMLSVDFISSGEEFTTLIDCIVERNYKNYEINDLDKVCLAKNIFRIDYLSDELIDMINLALESVREQLVDCDNFDELKSEFIENYIYSYMVRKYLFADSDYCFSNIGILINKENNSFKMAPNFDLESATMLTINDDYLRKDFDFVVQYFPNIAIKFYNKLKYLLIPTESVYDDGKSKFEQLVDESVDGDNIIKECLMANLRSNITRAKVIAGEELGMRCMF